MLTVLFYHAFFFLDYWLILLISAAITQVFNPATELAIHAGISANEAKAEIETQPVIAESNSRFCLFMLKINPKILKYLNTLFSFFKYSIIITTFATNNRKS